MSDEVKRIRRPLAPAACCVVGSHRCSVPVPIRGRVQGVDLCVADLVAALNAANLATVASCCGHGELPGSVALEDGRCLLVFDSIEEHNAAVRWAKERREQSEGGL